MRNISIISNNKIEQSYFESKLDNKKYNKKKYYTPSYKTTKDICYIYYDNSFIEKGTDEYKEYCMGLWDLIDDEENDWKKIKFPFESFYNAIDIEYHYELDILKEILMPFIYEDYYIITDCCDIIQIKDFVLNYNKLD